MAGKPAVSNLVGGDRMEYCVNKINPSYDFVVTGASYIGEPKANTAMYITKKIEPLLKNLVSVENCLVFAEDTIDVPDGLMTQNCFVKTENPQLAYAHFAKDFMQARAEQERTKQYLLTPSGYYMSETAKIGANAYIEPGCLIGHNVIIGDNATILAGTVIKNAVIGDFFIANENAVIGAQGFTMAEDVDGRKLRIPTLGSVQIGNHVEVGAIDNISCGSAGDTVIEDYVKLDALVYIGHDAYLSEGTEITAGGIVGGFVETGKHAYVGINSCLRNRIQIGADSIIGMGATVTKSVQANTTVAGNPARLFKKKEE